MRWPLMPLSQTLLMRIFPQEKHAQAMGLWAMTTVVGPILGPILGGLISDNLSWHWIFFINLPVGIICVLAAMRLLRVAETETISLRIDTVGLGLLILWIGALQLMLDLGHERDWFNSTSIIVLALTAAIGFVVFLIWELTDKHPVVDVKVFRHRGFAISVLALSLGFGAFFGSIVLIPQWLQMNLSYTATWAGYLTATMGFGSLTMSPIVAKLSTKHDPCAGELWFNFAGWCDLNAGILDDRRRLYGTGVAANLARFCCTVLLYSIVEHCARFSVAARDCICCGSHELPKNHGRGDWCFNCGDGMGRPCQSCP